MEISSAEVARVVRSEVKDWTRSMPEASRAYHRAASTRFSALEQLLQGLVDSTQQQQQHYQQQQQDMKKMLEEVIENQTSLKQDVASLQDVVAAHENDNTTTKLFSLERDTRQREREQKWKNEVVKSVKDELEGFKLYLKQRDSDRNEQLRGREDGLQEAMTDHMTSFTTAVQGLNTDMTRYETSFDSSVRGIATVYKEQNIEIGDTLHQQVQTSLDEHLDVTIADLKDMVEEVTNNLTASKLSSLQQQIAELRIWLGLIDEGDDDNEEDKNKNEDDGDDDNEEDKNKDEDVDDDKDKEKEKDTDKDKGNGDNNNDDDDDDDDYVGDDGNGNGDGEGNNENNNDNNTIHNKNKRQRRCKIGNSEDEVVDYNNLGNTESTSMATSGTTTAAASRRPDWGHLVPNSDPRLLYDDRPNDPYPIGVGVSIAGTGQDQWEGWWKQSIERYKLYRGIEQKDHHWYAPDGTKLRSIS